MRLSKANARVTESPHAYFQVNTPLFFRVVNTKINISDRKWRPRLSSHEHPRFAPHPTPPPLPSLRFVGLSDLPRHFRNFVRASPSCGGFVASSSHKRERGFSVHGERGAQWPRAWSCKILCTRRGNAAGGRKQIPFAAK